MTDPQLLVLGFLACLAVPSLTWFVGHRLYGLPD
jgi:hypothetical protein